MLVLSPLALSASYFVWRFLFVLQFWLSGAWLVCTSKLLSFGFLSVVLHITLLMLCKSISGIVNNAGPLPGTTKNLHLTHLILVPYLY